MAHSRFSHRMWGILNQSNTQIIIDWPENFLRKLMKLMGVPFAHTNLTKIDKSRSIPSKISPKIWLDLGYEFGIVSWDIQKDSNSKQTIVVKLKRTPTDCEYWQKKLSDALGGQFDISLI